MFLDDFIFKQWIDVRSKKPEPDNYDDLKLIVGLHPLIEDLFADETNETSLKGHFVAYVHVDGQLIEFGMFLDFVMI